MVGFRAPVGKTNLQAEKKRGRVVGFRDEAHVKFVDRSGAASSGPLVEVP